MIEVTTLLKQTLVKLEYDMNVVFGFQWRFTLIVTVAFCANPDTTNTINGYRYTTWGGGGS